MSLFDSYFDPEQFQDSGGLLGRLLSLRGEQGQYQPGAGFEPQPPADGQPASAPWIPLSSPIASPTWPNAASTPAIPQSPDYGQTQNIAIGNYQMPQFGRADVSQVAPLPASPDLGDRLSAGFQSWAHTPVGNPAAALANGFTGFNSGQRTDASAIVTSQIQATPQSPDLGDRLSAGFQSWAHTPVGNPAAALANGFTSFNSGQRTDASATMPSQIQVPPQSPDLGDRLSAGFQSWAHTPVGNPFAALANGITGVASGQRTDPASIARQVPQPRMDASDNPQADLNSQYQALRPALGNRNAMLAIVHPEAGKALIAQALAGSKSPSNVGTQIWPGIIRRASAMKQVRWRPDHRPA